MAKPNMPSNRKLRVVIDGQQFVVNGSMEIFHATGEDGPSGGERLVARYSVAADKFEIAENSTGSGKLEEPITAGLATSVSASAAPVAGSPAANALNTSQPVLPILSSAVAVPAHPMNPLATNEAAAQAERQNQPSLSPDLSLTTNGNIPNMNTQKTSGQNQNLH